MTQTAMQQHIEWLESTIEIAQEQTPILVNVLKLCLNDATQRLAMEKEQIVTTWNTAHQAGRFEGKGIAEDNWQTFETYWEETFKSE